MDLTKLAAVMCLVTGSFLSFSIADGATKPPNIVFIMADDNDDFALTPCGLSHNQLVLCIILGVRRYWDPWQSGSIPCN